MTTIVASKSHIGGDSMVFVPAKHQWYPVTKVRKFTFEDGSTAMVGAAGNGADCVRFLGWVEDGMDMEERPDYDEESGAEDEVIAIMVDETGIYSMMASDPCWEKVNREYHAVGSGSKAALGYFLACQKHKVQPELKVALEVAAEVCPYTRGPFHVLTLAS